MLNRRLKVLIIIPILLCFASAFRFNVSFNETSEQDSFKIWSSKSRLTWNDFKGIPDTLSFYHALTFTKTKYQTITENPEVINLSVVCYFNRTKSWTLEKSNKLLLKHEQLHFDIAELYTRKIRKQFKEYNWKDIDDSLNELDIIFDEVLNEKERLNEIYDHETAHGTIEIEQIKWQKKIEKELLELNDYSSTKVIIRRKK